MKHTRWRELSRHFSDFLRNDPAQYGTPRWRSPRPPWWCTSAAWCGKPAKMTKKWPKNDQKVAKNDQKMSKKDQKMRKNWPKNEQKWPKNDQKMTKKWPKKSKMFQFFVCVDDISCRDWAVDRKYAHIAVISAFANQKTQLFGRLPNVQHIRRGQRCSWLFVLHHVHTDHQALPAHISHNFVLIPQLGQLFDEVRSRFRAEFLASVFFDHLQGLMKLKHQRWTKYQQISTNTTKSINQSIEVHKAYRKRATLPSKTHVQNGWSHCASHGISAECVEMSGRW